MSRPCENSFADFCTSAILKALKINLLYSKKKQMVKFSEVLKCKSPPENIYIVSTLDCQPTWPLIFESHNLQLNTSIPHLHFDILGRGLLTQAVLASEKRVSMHLSVPTLHRNKVKDSCFLQDARIPMTIFLHSLPWDLHLRWCLHLHLWLTCLLRKPMV